MSNELVWIERGSSRALVAPGFAAALEELGALDPLSWQARFRQQAPTAAGGRGALCHASLADGTQLVLRGFRSGGWLAGLRGARLRSPTRLFDELRTTHQLARHGAPVALPAFAIAHRAGVSWTGGVATRRIAPARNALELLRSQPGGRGLARFAAAAGRAVRLFHDTGGRHADLHLGNLVVLPGDPPQVFVIDLDRARVGAPASPARRARELARLDRSLAKWQAESRDGSSASGAACGSGAGSRSESATLREQFLRAYVERDPALDAALRAALRRADWRLTLHRARYGWNARADS